MQRIKNRHREVKRFTSWRAHTPVYLTLLALLALFAFSNLAQAENQLASKPINVSIAFSDGDPPTSWSKDGIAAQGLLPELASAVFNRIDNIQLDAAPLPWPRAKLMAKKATVDGLLTYPSKSRQEYLLFSERPTYVMDYSYVIYNKNNPRSAELARLPSFRALGDFIMATEGPDVTDSWEEVNLPIDAFPRVYVNKAIQMFHLVLRRNSADYFIRNLEEAKYIARSLGYSEQLGYTKVTFKTQNVVPFHLGIQRSHPKSQYIIQQINAVQRSPEFEQEAMQIIKRYQ